MRAEEKLKKIVPKRLEEIKAIVLNFANEVADLRLEMKKEEQNV